MNWRELLFKEREVSVPWYGQTKVELATGELLKLKGAYGKPYGWISASVGRTLEAKFTGYLTEEQKENAKRLYKGSVVYICGNRYIIPVRKKTDTIRDILSLPYMSICLIPEGDSQETITKARVAMVDSKTALYLDREHYSQADDAVLERLAEGSSDISDIKHVTPDLEIAFKFAQAIDADRRRLRLEAEIAAEAARVAQERAEQRERLVQSVASSTGRRQLASVDFAEAARATLRQVRCEVLSARVDGTIRWRLNEDSQQFWCRVDPLTLRVVDAGICLAGADAQLTLEALPSVVREAIEEDLLVVTWH